MQSIRRLVTATSVTARRASLAPLLAMAVALPAAAQPATRAEPPRISLADAVAKGMTVAPDIADARGSVTVAEASQRRAKGSYLPSLSASAGTALASTERFDPNTSVTVSGAGAQLNAGLGLSWDVYTGGRRSAERTRTAAQLESFRSQLISRERDLVLRITTAWYGALNVERLERVAASRLERAQVQLEAAKRRAEMGAATKSDVLRAELEVFNARTQGMEVETLLRAHRLELGRLVGERGPVAPTQGAEEPAGALELSAEELESLVSEHPDVASAMSSLEATRATVQQAKAGWLPQVRLSGGYDWFSPLPDVTEGRTGWSVRLGLSYPIFDGWARDETMQRARVNVTVAESQVADLQRAVRTELERALDEERLAAWRVEVSRSAVEAAREDLRVQQERYAVGTTTMLDLLTSQERLVQAETDAIDASLARAIARAQWVALTGRAP